MSTRPTRIQVSEEERSQISQELNICLAETLYAVLASKFAHWNVKGTGFYPAHKLFDQIYEFYSGAADRLGERITALGADAEGLADSAAACDISYGASAQDNVLAHTQAMADMLGKVVNSWRETAAGTNTDSVTENLLLELTEEGDKQLYFLEASLRTS